jgi:hypothetical protein
MPIITETINNMESNQSLFSLSIDPVTKDHLGETAKWARFLAVTGMIGLIVLVILGLSSIWFTTFMNEAADPDFGGIETGNSEWLGVFMAVYTIVIALIWFFPLLYMLRFANRLRTALRSNDQQALNQSFMNLKRTMRYVGIVTIIMLAVMVLGLVLAIMGVAAAS